MKYSAECRIANIPENVRRCEWDVDCAARNLITTLPPSYRIKCPDYPSLTDSVAMREAVDAVASNIRIEVQDSKRCNDPDAVKIARLALVAMGYEGARSLRLLRPQKD